MSQNLPFGRQQEILIEPRTSFNKKELKDILKMAGLKFTNQRLAILNTLNTGPHYHKTAKDILIEAQKTYPSIGFATVYRLLKKLCQAQQAIEISMGSSSSYYELKTNQSHYHIACVECGKIIEFQNKMLEEALEKVISEKGYKAKKKTIEVYVTCDHCQ